MPNSDYLMLGGRQDSMSRISMALCCAFSEPPASLEFAPSLTSYDLSFTTFRNDNLFGRFASVW